MVNDDNEVRLSVAEMIKEQLKEAGIEIEIKRSNGRTNLTEYRAVNLTWRLSDALWHPFDISFCIHQHKSGQGLIFPVTAMKRLTGILLDFEGKGSVNEESLFY